MPENKPRNKVAKCINKIIIRFFNDTEFPRVKIKINSNIAEIIKGTALLPRRADIQIILLLVSPLTKIDILDLQ